MSKVQERKRDEEILFICTDDGDCAVSDFRAGFRPGLHHFRFTQSGGPFFLGSNSTVGWLVGGGLDIHMGERVALRGEADYLGTHYFDKHQRNYQIIAGLVFNF